MSACFNLRCWFGRHEKMADASDGISIVIRGIKRVQSTYNTMLRVQFDSHDAMDTARDQTAWSIWSEDELTLEAKFVDGMIQALDEHGREAWFADIVIDREVRA